MSPFPGRAALQCACSQVLGLPVSAGLPGISRNGDAPSYPTRLPPQRCGQGREVARAGGGIFEAMLSAISRLPQGRHLPFKEMSLFALCPWLVP